MNGKNIVSNKQFTAMFLMMIGVMVFAPDLAADFANAAADIEKQSKNSAGSIIGAMKYIAQIIGFGFIIWGAYDLFIAEDPQKQGKKSQGGMKIVGGAVLVLAAAFVKWATGESI